ncbi:MAG: squalene/phytoene synthase family protein [Planctomycetes bacterium]|nr:squalene/phytoene synthase family protein [Planctomycetota bacterium]NUQ35117.1 squalene/phytoene synthase family protein [Planctomycetaceae bacterium]
MASPLTAEQQAFVSSSLNEVSRTFALGIGLLRQPLRDEVGVAYLICRVLDTIEDTTQIDGAVRAGLLDELGRAIARDERLPAESISRVFQNPSLAGPDIELCRRASLVSDCSAALDKSARAAMRGPVVEMAHGMAETVRAQDGGIRPQNFEELDRYCYFVAGTVGKLLTALYAARRESITPAIRAELERWGVPFGLGLQITNIIKDAVADFTRGVVYMPGCVFDGAAITSALKAPDGALARNAIAKLVGHALTHLRGGLRYTLAVPAAEKDIRLFCALPLMFALRTLHMAATASGSFSATKEVKISRAEVSELSALAEGIATDNARLEKHYNGVEAEIASALAVAGATS